jgi:hypothetical protein
MVDLVNRAADRLLGRFAPRITAAAAPPCGSFYGAFYCYCSRGLAYREICWQCGGVIICAPCQVSGTC